MIARTTAILLFGVWSLCAASQPSVLMPDSERGFLRLMQMAQKGAFGSDVANANVRIDVTSVNVELVRSTPPNQTFVLTIKTAAPGPSRYFDIEGREGTTPEDVARFGRAIDGAFDASPFQKLRDDGRARGHGAMQPTMASKTYTIAVIVVVGAALVAGLLLLWGYAPPPR